MGRAVSHEIKDCITAMNAGMVIGAYFIGRTDGKLEAEWDALDERLDRAIKEVGRHLRVPDHD